MKWIWRMRMEGGGSVSTPIICCVVVVGGHQCVDVQCWFARVGDSVARLVNGSRTSLQIKVFS